MDQGGTAVLSAELPGIRRPDPSGTAGVYEGDPCPGAGGGSAQCTQCRAARGGMNRGIAYKICHGQGCAEAFHLEQESAFLHFLGTFLEEDLQQIGVSSCRSD